MSDDSVFIEVLQRRLEDFSILHDYMWGYVVEHSYADLLNELKTLGYSYSIRSSEMNKGKNAVTFSFKSSNPSDAHFLGSPFVSLKRINLQCILGPDHHRRAKEDCETGDHPVLKKKRKQNTNTKKMGCPATISVKAIEIYDKYVVSETSSQDERRQVLRTLKCELDSESPPKGQVRYYMKVVGKHTHERTLAEMNERIHPSLMEEIYKLVDRGVACTREIEIYLRRFVENMDSKPNFCNKAFYPCKDVIYYHINQALFKIHGGNNFDDESSPPYVNVSESSNESSSSKSLPPCVNVSDFDDDDSSNESSSSKLLQSQQQLRESLKYLSDVSYLCNDQDYINSCLEKVQAMCSEVAQKLPSSSGLPLLPDTVNTSPF